MKFIIKEETLLSIDRNVFTTYPALYHYPRTFKISVNYSKGLYLTDQKTEYCLESLETKKLGEGEIPSGMDSSHYDANPNIIFKEVDDYIDTHWNEIVAKARASIPNVDKATNLTR